MKPSYDQLVKENAELRKENAELRKLVNKLMSRIDKLEAQLKKNSKNSSKPPSSDQKSSLPNRKSKESRAYHTGASRQLLPESKVTSKEVRIKKQCTKCGGEMTPTGQVLKWQQVELPEIQPLVHQFELHSSSCQNCNAVNHPQLEEHEKFLLGPRLEALTNICLGQFRQGHQAVRQFIATIIPDIQLSQGIISKIKLRSAKALYSAADLIKKEILSADEAIYADATGWRHMSSNQHAVILRTTNLVSYSFEERLNQDSISQLFEGHKISHLVTDRGFATGKLNVKIHQFCLAHLLRNICGLAEHPATTIEETEKLGYVYDMIQKLFHDKHRFQKGEIAENTWRNYSYGIWAEVREIFEDFQIEECSAKVKRFSRRALKDFPRFTAYLRNRDAPMTNNRAEEGLRNLVIARKLCFGSRSIYGRSWRSVFHSCLESLKRSGSSMLDFLTDTLIACRHGATSPDILTRISAATC